MVRSSRGHGGMDATALAGLSSFPAAQAGQGGVRGAGQWQRGHPVEGIPPWDDDDDDDAAGIIALGKGSPRCRPPSPGSLPCLCHLVPSTRTGTDPASHPQGNSPAALENRLSSPWARQGCAGRTPEMPQRPHGKCRLAAGRTERQVWPWGGWRERAPALTAATAPGRERKARSSWQSCLCFSGIVFPPQALMLHTCLKG